MITRKEEDRRLREKELNKLDRLWIKRLQSLKKDLFILDKDESESPIKLPPKAIKQYLIDKIEELPYKTEFEDE